MITKIAIENIKGFGSPAKELKMQLVPGKPNIVVAPNGFGKSSLCKAFDCLKPQGIMLTEMDYYENNKDARPSLLVECNNVQYITDQARNEVFDHFQCFCINSPLKPESITKRILGKYNQTKDYLGIEHVILMKSTPVVKDLAYSSSEFKTTFGINGKLLPNINAELHFLDRFPFAEMEAFGGDRKWAKAQNVVNALNSLEGSADSIMDSVKDELFAALYMIPEYEAIAKEISSAFHCETRLDVFLRFWILKRLYFFDKRTFKQAVERNRFNAFVSSLNSSIRALNTTWVDVQAAEEGRQLILRFPKADAISYGQRDSLYLFASLERIKNEMNTSRPVILIVDELFDYLDAVNMTVIQYFFSEFISYCRKRVEIYPIILTHLSPEYYHNYTFAEMKVHYLGFPEGVTDTPTKRLLKARGNSANDSVIYEDVSKYLLHYHTNTINSEETFVGLGLKKKWGSGYGFWEYLIAECNKYFSGDPFDYYAISTAVRVRIEKLVYSRLNEEDRAIFLDEINGTKNKLKFAIDRGVEVPDIYNLLGIIYNDAEHLPLSSDANKPIVYRLNNPVIRHMIHEVFNRDATISLSHLC